MYHLWSFLAGICRHTQFFKRISRHRQLTISLLSYLSLKTQKSLIPYRHLLKLLILFECIIVIGQLVITTKKKTSGEVGCKQIKAQLLTYEFRLKYIYGFSLSRKFLLASRLLWRSCMSELLQKLKCRQKLISTYMRSCCLKDRVMSKSNCAEVITMNSMSGARNAQFLKKGLNPQYLRGGQGQTSILCFSAGSRNNRLFLSPPGNESLAQKNTGTRSRPAVIRVRAILWIEPR